MRMKQTEIQQQRNVEGKIISHSVLHFHEIFSL